MNQFDASLKRWTSLSSECPILLIEDNDVLLNLFADFLNHDGYTLFTVSVEKMHHIETIFQLIEEKKIELVMINLRITHADGPTLFVKIREHFKDLPMLVLVSHMDQVGELVRSSDGDNYCVGITDFIAKPYQPRVILARIRSILNAQRLAVDDLLPQHGWIWFDANSLQVRVRVEDDQYEETLTLTPIEFKLLKHFVEHPYRIFSREQLMRLVYADQRFVDESVIDRHISNLGAKLRRLHPKGAMISVVGGIGYRFEQP